MRSLSCYTFPRRPIQGAVGFGNPIDGLGENGALNLWLLLSLT